jgi:hypothetical protein
MKVAAVVTDLMLYSRIESAARVAGVELARVDDPQHVPPDAELVLVDWSDRRADWAEALQPSPGRRVIVFGPHTDLEAHADARAGGVGPMWARSKMLASLQSLFADGRSIGAELGG